jgi:hypothetical protein
LGNTPPLIRIIVDRGAKWEAQSCKNLKKSTNFSPESVAGSQNNGPTRIRQGLREKKKTPRFASAGLEPRSPCRYIQRPAARRLEPVRIRLSPCSWRGKKRTRRTRPLLDATSRPQWPATLRNAIPYDSSTCNFTTDFAATGHAQSNEFAHGAKIPGHGSPGYQEAGTRAGP